VVNIIGSTETGTMVIWDSRRDADAAVNDFRVLPFTAVQVVDGRGAELPPGETGTLLVSTDAVLVEYHGNPSLTKEKISLRGNRRWFDTGDLVKQLPDGRIRLVGRSKRIIKRGGNLVFPEEIEAFLLTHPLILAVAVRSEPHEIFGEMIIAHVQISPDTPLHQGDIIKFCKGTISSYKIPDRFIILHELPKDIGKVQFKYLTTSSEKDHHG
jgi:fatty-acyl-CoA synthase